MATSLRMPTKLGAEGRNLWKAITTAHPELGPDAARVLVDACREADLVQRLEVELRDSPLMVRGSQGQMVSSPLVSEVRQHRAVLSALLKALRLPATAGGAERAQQEASEKARMAARTRWDRPKLVS